MNTYNKIGSGKTSSTRKMPPVWSESSAPHNERYVKVSVKTLDGDYAPVHARFPLSLLRHYSKRAQGELPKLGSGKPGETIDWTIHASVSGREEAGAMVAVLKWFLYKLPAAGFSNKYKGNPQFDTNFLPGASMSMLICTVLVMWNLDLPHPVKEQKVLPAVIADHIREQGVSPAELILLLNFRDTPLHWLVNKGAGVAIDYYDADNENGASQAELDEMYHAREGNADLDALMKETEQKKENRLMREERSRKHQEWLVREARRRTRAAAAEEKLERQVDRIYAAKDGDRALNDYEVDAVMRKRKQY